MMFERITKIDNSREADGPREKHHSIEMSDKDHRESLEVKLVYRPPPPEEKMNPELKEKFKIARDLTKDTQVTKLKQGKKSERKENKNPTSKAKKNDSKSNGSTVAQV